MYGMNLYGLKNATYLYQTRLEYPRALLFPKKKEDFSNGDGRVAQKKSV